MFYSSDLWSGDTIDIHIFNEKCNDWSKTSGAPTLPRFRHCLSNGDILFVRSEGKELYRVNLDSHTIKSLGKGSGELCTGYNSYSESLVFINGMKTFYEKEDRFQYFFLKKDHESEKEEMQMNKNVRGNRKRKRRRSKRSQVKCSQTIIKHNE